MVKASPVTRISGFVLGLILALAGILNRSEGLAVIAAQGNPAVTVSAATFSAPVAPNSIASIFGVSLATATEVAGTIPLPVTLAGTSVGVKDSLGVTRPAQLFFVSSGQVNCLIPADTATGLATLTIVAGNATMSTGTVQIVTAAPGIFSANSNGSGVPAANVFSVFPDSSRTVTDPFQGPPPFTARPIDLGSESTQVFLVLYLTGLRGTPNTDGDNVNGSAENVSVLMAGLVLVPTYAGFAPGLSGLDQINVLVPRSLIGRGVVSLSVVALGFGASNAVEVDIGTPQGPSPPNVTGVIGPSNLLARDQLMLNGTLFSSMPSENLVRIGGIEAGVESASPSQLQVRTPFGAITGTITVSTSGGYWTSASVQPVRTSISGEVRDTFDQPIQGAKISLVGSSTFVTTAAEGWFVLPDAPSLAVVAFKIETPPSDPPYPTLPAKMNVVSLRDNPYAGKIYLEQASGAEINIGGPGFSFSASGDARTSAVEGSISEAGVTLTLPDGLTAVFPNGATSGRLVLDVLQNSLTPAPLPPGIFSSSIAQITPFGVQLAPGAKLTFPNADGYPPNTAVKLFRFDLNEASRTVGSFIDSGKQAFVSSDGARIETEATAITETSLYLVALERPTTTIVGRVFDSNGITPQRGATVRARGQETRTDGNGGFVLSKVPTLAGVKIPVTASLLRSSGRVDRITGETLPAIVNGVTRIADLILPSATSNRPPLVFTKATINTWVDEVALVPVLVNDLDQGQTIANVALTGPNFVLLTSEGPGVYRLSVSPKGGNLGTHTVAATATDSAGGATRFEIKVIVKPRPIAVSMALNTVEDIPLQMVLEGSDSESRPLTFQLTNPPANGNLSGQLPAITYTPRLNFNGQDSFRFSVNNGFISSADATVTINVTPASDPPVLVVPGPVSTNVGAAVSFNVGATDPDAGQAITLSASNLPAGSQFNQTGPLAGVFNWTPSAAQVGTHVITFTARDNGQPPMSDMKTVAVTVNGQGTWAPTSGPDGGTVTAFLNSGSAIFAGTNGDGIFRTTDNGVTWLQSNNGLGNGFIRAFASLQVPGGVHLFAATEGGVYRTMDLGQLWSPVNNGLTNPSVRALTVAQGFVFAGTNGGGVFRLSGNTWSQMNGGLQNLGISALTSIGEVVLAANADGVFASNLAAMWAPFGVALPSRVISFVVRATPGGVQVIAGTFTTGVYQRLLGGGNWTALNVGLSNPNVNSLALGGDLLFAGTEGGGVFRLDLSGVAQWAPANTGLTNPIVLSLITSGQIVFAGTQEGGVFRSVNNGNNWSTANNGMPRARVTNLLSTGNVLFAGTNGGGVFGTMNGGIIWTGLNVGLTNLVVSSMSASGNSLFIGTFGGGVFRSTNNGGSWMEVNSGLGNLFVQSLGLNGTTLFAGTDAGAIFRSIDNGGSWILASAGLGVRPVYALIATGGSVFAGTRGGGVFRSLDNGSSWNAMNNGLGNVQVGSFAVIGGALFAGSLDSGVYRTTNNGANWTAVNIGLTRSDVYALAVNGTTLFAGTKGGGVFVSTNLGNNWTAMNQGLVFPFVLSLTGNGTSLFAGTDGGGVWVLR